MEAALGGIVSASLTPVDRNGRIDLGRLTAHIRRLLGAGCRFVSTFGSTGEGPSFSLSEKHWTMRGLQRAGIPMQRLIPAAMSPSVDDTAASIASAAEFGCRAVLVLPPFYYGAAKENGIAAFYAAVAERLGGAFPLDVILYHIPAMSRIGFSPELIETLTSRFARIVGVKDSTGEVAHTVMLARRFPRLSIFTGDDRVLPDLLRAGGAGLIGGLPNVSAHDLAAIHADPDGTGAAQRRQAKRIEAVDAFGSIPALKAVLAEMLGDAAWEEPMPPLGRLSAPDRKAVIDAFRETGFVFSPTGMTEAP